MFVNAKLVKKVDQPRRLLRPNEIARFQEKFSRAL